MYDTWERDDQGAGRSLAIGLLVLAGGVLAAYAARGLMQRRAARPAEPEDAPQLALRGKSSRGWRERALVGRSVTINRPRAELYRFWRDFPNLAHFMENVKDVTVLDERRSHWTIAAPGGTEVAFTATVTEDKPNELIAWLSDEDASVRNSGRIEFRDAPGGRGTVVSATIAYDPPAGTLGRLAGKLFQREPNIQARRELKRFKQLMETGEIAIATPGGAAPRA